MHLSGPAKLPTDKLSIVRDGPLNIPVVAGSTTTSVNLANGLLAVEQSGSLFQTEALGFDDEDVTEDALEGEPTTVDNL